MIKIFFDLETTGTNSKKHSVVQLSGLIEIKGEIVDSFNYSVRPHPKAQIEAEALKVNNKTEEQIQGFPPMEDVHRAFVKKLAKYIAKYDSKDKAWLVGFNNRSFDDIFLRKFFELCGDKFFGSCFWQDSLDVLVLSSQYLLDRRTGMPSFKLKRVAKELGIVVDEKRLHDAVYDVELTREIYRIVTGLEFEI